MSRAHATAGARDRRTPPASSHPRRAGLTLNDRLVRERDRERARELLRTLGLGIVVLVPLLLHVFQQVKFVETAYRVAELRSERLALETALRNVRMERASLESLARIEVEARGLGLIQPPPEAVIMVVPVEPGEMSDP